MVTSQRHDWIGDVLASLPPLCTTAEAAKALRTSRRNLYRLTSAGRIRAVRREHAGSSRLLIPRTEIERYLRSLAA